MLRLIPAGFLFLLSLLTVFKAPTNFFFRVQVAVTEFPWLFIAASLLLLTSCYWQEKYKGLTITVTLIALALSCLPVIRAYMRSSTLRDEMTARFPGGDDDTKDQLPSAFSFWQMFSGMSEEVVPSQHVYRRDGAHSWDFDLYASAAKTKSPCVIVIHSGSWSSGDNKEFPQLNSYLANRGYNVAAINYRLAPQYKSPSQVEDVGLLIQMLKDRADQFNIDTGNFILLGRSAGGQIALCAAYTLNDAAIKGVISYYSPADMVWGAGIKGNKLVLNTDQVFADYLGGGYDQFAAKYHESSACDHVSITSPPTLIIHGDNDCMVSHEHSVRLNRALDSLNRPHFFLSLKGATHACDYNLSGPSGQLCTYTVERFIAWCVKTHVGGYSTPSGL